MKTSRVITALMVLLMAFAFTDLHSQKLKDLGLKKAKNKLKNLVEEATGTEEKQEQNNEDNTSGKKTLDTRMSPAEVLQSLDDAQDAVDNKDYSDARYSIQQALVEIERQLGEKVLAAMPKTAMGQSYDPEEDMVLSTGVGFVGLEIKREYPSSNGNIEALIGNNAAILAPYSMALSNPQYISQNEDMKSVRVDGKKGILELAGDEYRLAVPFGQSSIFFLSCESCNNEGEVLSLAGEFDLDKYLGILGEAPINVQND